MPGRASSRARTSSRSALRSSGTSPAASAAHRPTSARPRERGIGRVGRVRAASTSADGKSRSGRPRLVGAGHAAVLARPAGPVTVAGAGHRDLLADDRADRDLVAVDVAGHAEPGRRSHQPGEQRVLGQRVLHRDTGRSRRRAAAGSARRPADVAQVLDGEPAAHEAARGHASSRSSPTRPVPCGRRRVRAYQPGPPASTPATAHGEEGPAPCAGERRAHRQPQVEGADAGRRTDPRPAAQLGGRGGVDLADGVVELADAGEAGGERHVAERHRRGLHEHPGRSAPGGPGQGQRPGPELGDEQAVEVPRGVAHPVGQPLDPVALDDAVGDQPHRPAGDVGRHVPVR